MTSFLVSRDGTRFVAVVRTRQPGLPGVTVDELRVGRLELQDANTQVIRVRATEAITLGGSDQPRVKDIAWTSTTTIAVLSTISTRSLQRADGRRRRRPDGHDVHQHQ